MAKVSLAETGGFSDEVSSEEPRFPTLFLSDDQVEALGLTGAGVGDTFEMTATVRVVSVSTHAHRSPEEHTNVSLDVVEAELNNQPTSHARMAKVMFGDG